VETIAWSAKELRLVQGVVKRWRAMRAFKMAEQILTGAVDLREANVIAYVLLESD
jgi:kinesin family protein 1